MFRELNKREEKEFRDGVLEDEKLQDTLKYLSLCHPVTREEFIKQIKKLGIKW